MVEGIPPKFYHGIRAEVVQWEGHPPEQLAAMTAHVDRLKEKGIEAID